MPRLAAECVDGFLGIDLSRTIGLLPGVPVVNEPLPTPTFYKTDLITEAHTEAVGEPVFSAGEGGKVSVQIGVDGKPGAFVVLPKFYPMVAGAPAAGARIVLASSGDRSAGVLDNEHGRAVARTEEAIC